MKNLIILPFDHRSSFVKVLLNKNYFQLNLTDRKKVIAYKKIIFEAFLKVYKKTDKSYNLAILVDEEFGLEILKTAKQKKILTILTVEKTAQPEFLFDYGKNFDSHIKKINPSFVKVLVRYNIQDKEKNLRQIQKLKKLSDFCEKNNFNLLFELLVEPTKKDLQLTGNVSKFYNSQLRVKKTVSAIKEILKNKIKVKIWKLEGFSKNNWSQIVNAVNNDSQIVVLGRGENKKTVIKWLTATKSFEKIIGFAVGRTIFQKPLQDFVAKKKNKTQTVAQIAKNFESFIKIWIKR